MVISAIMIYLDGYNAFKTDEGKIYIGKCKDDIRHVLDKLITSKGKAYQGLFRIGEYIGSSSMYRG
jgi:hypothetical protein